MSEGLLSGTWFCKEISDSGQQDLKSKTFLLCYLRKFTSFLNAIFPLLEKGKKTKTLKENLIEIVCVCVCVCV